MGEGRLVKLGICINAVHHSEFASAELGAGSAAGAVREFVDAVSARFRDGDTSVAGVHLMHREDGAPAEFPAGWTRHVVPDNSEAYFLSVLGSVTGDYDCVLYLLSDTPLLHVDSSRELIALHVDYFAQFTGSDGYPLGCLPEVFEGEFPHHIQRLAKEGEPAPRELFPIVLRDVNAFDVETMIAHTDARPLRLDLSCASPRGTELCRRFIDLKGRTPDEVAEAVLAGQDRLRVVPAFAAVQVVENHSQKVSYLPHAKAGVGVAGQEMPLERFFSLVDDLERFSPGIVIQVSLWGEVGLHSEVTELVRGMEERESAFLLLETSGVGWNEAARRALREMSLKRSRLVVDLDAHSENVYHDLRGEGFGEATGFAGEMLGAHGDRVFVRATRMKENAQDVELFYRHWKEQTENVIVQKYDHFCGVLPDRRLVDISPVERMPCWHLKRDLAILLDGTVPMCREDLDREHLLGNIFEDGAVEIWARNEEHYQSHVDGSLQEICRKCDEYYTFNF
jgi:spiro-SPASM protein